MLHALSAPVLPSLAVAGLALGIGAAVSSPEPADATYRLRLCAKSEPDHLYLSRFRDGDILLRLPRQEIQSVTLHTRAHVSDGCRWLGIERLTPRNAYSFHYDYSERRLSCDPGAKPATPTPRRGVVYVIE